MDAVVEMVKYKMKDVKVYKKGGRFTAHVESMFDINERYTFEEDTAFAAMQRCAAALFAEAGVG